MREGPVMMLKSEALPLKGDDRKRREEWIGGGAEPEAQKSLRRRLLRAVARKAGGSAGATL